MYRIYNTEGIVLKSMGVREANRFYWIYTRDLGLVTASAQGVRLNKSKLRFALQDYSVIDISLVRGQGGWRVTGASSRWNIYSSFSNDRNKLATGLNVLSLMRRLVQGELPDATLFDMVHDNLLVLKDTSLTKDEIIGFEALWVLKILELLGYIGESKVKDDAHVLWEERAWDTARGKRKDFTHTINQALRSTQM